MLRRMTAAGVTAGVNLSPPAGFKWVVLYAAVRLITSATAGTRSAFITISDILNSTIISTNSQTGVSTSYGAAVSADSTYNQQFRSSYELPDSMILSVGMVLISGDTVSYDVLVDEVVDG